VRTYGHIASVPVGTTYKTRRALHDAGVHGPLIAGISGREGEPADSIVVSGGYEDDVDLGTLIIYTGHGGNDPATGRQIADQQLTRGNAALAVCVERRVPVRVVRGAHRGATYAPERGYRYDGLFFVDRYWHEIGKSGFRIWRFELRGIEGEAITATAPVIPPRREARVNAIIRDQLLAQRVKELHGYACQVCGIILHAPTGLYAEAAHIRPLGLPHNGSDIAENLLCLCPNHHKLLDLGAIGFRDDWTVINFPGSLRIVPQHNIGPHFVAYHREHFGLLV
jgi:putative restriction endonuclease